MTKQKLKQPQIWICFRTALQIHVLMSSNSKFFPSIDHNWWVMVTCRKPIEFEEIITCAIKISLKLNKKRFYLPFELPSSARTLELRMKKMVNKKSKRCIDLT
jgi:hypothetical protein